MQRIIWVQGGEVHVIEQLRSVKGKVLDSKHGSDASPHYQILVEGEEQTKYRVAVNIKSQSYPSEVLYFVSDQFRSEDLAALPNLPAGFMDIKNNHPDIALDFIRGNLFDPKRWFRCLLTLKDRIMT